MMKHLSLFTLAAFMTVLPVFRANAIEVKPSMTWELGMGWADNLGFTDARQGAHTDAFTAKQRIRPQFDFVVDERLKAVLGFEIEFAWGDQEGGGLDADRANAGVRRAYLDWSPTEKLALRMGLQGAALPSATFGNPILDDNVTGVMASYTVTDSFGITGFWLRALDKDYGTNQTGGKNFKDELDLFGVTLPVRGEGFTLTPWGMYGRNGDASGFWNFRADDADFSNDYGIRGSTDLWFTGAAFTLDVFAPFSLRLDAMYGAARGSDAPEFSGYLFSGLFEYATGTMWGNPGILGWYASGDDASDFEKGSHGKYGRMPIISNEDAGFAPAAFGFPGDMGCMADGLISNSGVGTWGLGVQLDGITFLDDLSHTVRAVYIRGTNDKDIIRRSGATRHDVPFALMGESVYLTTKDRAWEFDLISTYEATENLTLYLEGSYVKLDLDSGVWGSKDSRTTDAWKAQLLFEFSF